MKRKRNESPPCESSLLIDFEIEEEKAADVTRRKEKKKRSDQVLAFARVPAADSLKLPAREPQEGESTPARLELTSCAAAAEAQQVNLSDALKTCLPACLVYVNVLTAVDPHQSKPTYRPSHKTRTRCPGKRRKRRKRRLFLSMLLAN